MSPNTTDSSVRRLRVHSAEKMRKMTALSRRIKEEMIERNLSQTELAAFLGLQKDDLSRYYNKKGLPSPLSMLKIAARLGVSPNEVVPGWTDDNEKVVPLRKGRRSADTGQWPEFEIVPASVENHVVLHVYKMVPMEVALEIGRLVNAANAANRG